MEFYTTIQDFTGVYEQQPLMRQLRDLGGQGGIYWLNCTKISGTDCYCDDDAQSEIQMMMDQVCTSESPKPGIHFFDNGNYHYMSKLWTDRIQEPFDLVVFDHHPDMQPPRFEGILSCGGWVKEVLDHNSFVRNVVLIGVADDLIEEIKNEPSAEFEKYAARVNFIPKSSLSRGTADMALKALDALPSENIYISIDKDALSQKDAITNWDQGTLNFEQLKETLCSLFANRKILGIDICGERACNQDYDNGMDEGSADAINNNLNQKLLEAIHGF